jgi:PadR family transcriptional regulator, regulatory protein AphA
LSLANGLLGLLRYAPMSGYDLKKIFDESVNFFWSAQTSQIYRELAALERKECVESSIEPGHAGPNRRVYRITEAGKDRLKSWLSDVSSEIGEDDRNEFLMRVFLSSNIGGDELLRQLNLRLAKYRADLAKLKSIEAGMHKYGELFDVAPEILYWRISLSRGYHDVESHIRWAQESIALLEAHGFRADRLSVPDRPQTRKGRAR